MTEEARTIEEARTRAMELWVVRVSGRDNEALAGMLAQTVALFRDVPGALAVEELGIAPLLSDGPLPPGVQVEDRSSASLKAALVYVDGIHVLLAKGSAASGTEPGENAFVQLLTQTLGELRPVNVRVATISRLLRSSTHTPAIQHAVLQHVDKVHIGPLELDFKGPSAHIANLLWNVLGMVAAMERDLIVQRMQAGLISAARKGRWPLGDRVQPIGYAVNAATGSLDVDPEQTAAAQLLWETLATERNADRVLTTMAASRLAMGIPAEDLLKHSSPTAWVNTQLSYAEFYRTGTIRLSYPNRFPGAVEVNGVPVDYATSGAGVIHLDFSIARQPIDEAAIDAALTLWSKKRPTGLAAGRTLPPLNGHKWTTGEWDYILRGYSVGSYEVRRRSLDRVGMPWAHLRLMDGRRCGIIDAQQLHQSVLTSLTKALREGVQGQVLDDVRIITGLSGVPVMDDRDARVERMEGQLATARRRASKARQLAIDADELSQGNFLDDATMYATEASRLADEITRERARESASSAPAEVELPGAYIRAAAAALLSRRVDRSVHDALHSILHDLQLDPDSEGFNWTTTFMVPSSGRAVRLGPVTGRVDRVGHKASGKRCSSHHPVPPAERKELRRRLVRSSVPVSVHIAACDSPNAWIARLLLGDPLQWHDEDPAFNVEAFEDHVREIWMRGKPVSPVHYLLVSSQRQAAVDIVAAHGGEMDVQTLADSLKARGFSRHHVYQVTYSPAQLERPEPWLRGHARSESKARCIECPQCGGWATGVLAAPEVPDWLLCLTCLQAPAKPGIVFPKIYRSLAAGNR